MPRYLMSVFADVEYDPIGNFASKEEMLQSFADTGTFNEQLQRDGYLVFADGLEAPATATTVDGRGEAPVLTDGPYLETKEHLGGFWVIEVPDLDVALDLAARASRACRETVEVRPFHTSESIRAMLDS